MPGFFVEYSPLHTLDSNAEARKDHLRRGSRGHVSETVAKRALSCSTVPPIFLTHCESLSRSSSTLVRPSEMA